MSFEHKLKNWLGDCRKLVVLGIGNPLRGDDALGLDILKILKGKVSTSVGLIECQTTPENFTGKIKRLKPSHVLMIDAACFGANPGRARLVPPEKIAGVAVSTHAMPLHMLAEILEKSVGAKVVLLAVQPKIVDFGEGLTPELEGALKKIGEQLLGVLGEVFS